MSLRAVTQRMLDGKKVNQESILNGVNPVPIILPREEQEDVAEPEKPPRRGRKKAVSDISEATLAAANASLLGRATPAATAKRLGFSPPNPPLQEPGKEDPIRQDLIRTVSEYWRRFPSTVEGQTMAQRHKFLQKASNEEIKAEIKRCSAALGAGFADELVGTAVYDGGAKLTQIANVFFPRLGDMTGTFEDLKEAGALDTEISEISIILEKYVNLGPFGRMLVKIFRAAAARKVLNAISDQATRHINSDRMKATGAIPEATIKKFAHL